MRAPQREDDVDELAAGGTREQLQQLVDPVICGGPDCTNECCEDDERGGAS